LFSGGNDGAGMLPETMDVTFAANGTTFELRLRRNRAIMVSGAKHLLRRRDGSSVEGPMPAPCFYIGDVVGDPSGSAGVSTCGGGVTGLVLAHGRAMELQPSSSAKIHAKGEHSWASPGSMRHSVRRIHDPEFRDYQADVARFVQGVGTKHKVPPHGRRLTGASTKHVEVFVFNDHRRFQDFGGTSGLADLAQHSVDVLNAVSIFYRTPPTNGAIFPYTVQIVLVGQQTFVEADPWESTVVMSGSETEPSSLLDHFNQWGTTQLEAGLNGVTDYDNRVLLSGRDFQGSTVGLAGVSTMCWKARSGNINMCGTGSSAIASCASVVAHEMGHNFGMHHDSSGNDCPSSGLIMEAVGDSDPSEQFSSCSVTYITSFFDNTYASNGQCLENLPTRVEGDPICGNGFVEDGEDCDCGGADCSGTDPCCDGSTCKFADAAYECSASAGPCCESCMFVASSASKVCRDAQNACDLPEYCPGGTADCPMDVFVYPGKACTVSGYDGMCSGGRCQSMAKTCAVDITRDFDGTWDLTEECAKFNDDCQQVVCHDASQASAYKCGQAFATHGKQMTVPDGTPCWFPGAQYGTRTGMCAAGECKLPHMLAEVPLCGNGGIDFGEECDCGDADTDTCCECATCTLKAGMECSSQEPCCDDTCQFKSSGTVCRAAVGECDLEEVCSGSSGVCPSDVGEQWGTACTDASSNPSTCYGKVCQKSLEEQCATKTDGAKPFGDRAPDDVAVPEDSHTCTGLMCCENCETLIGNVSIGGVVYTNPYFCSPCMSATSYHEFTVDGVTNRIYLGAAADGTVLSDASKICVDAQLVTPDSSCGTGEFLEASIGKCLSCDPACSACTGPSNFDCIGDCVHGQDSRGACAISADQVSFANGVTDASTSSTSEAAGGNSTDTTTQQTDTTSTEGETTRQATTASASMAAAAPSLALLGPLIGQALA